MTHQKFNRKNLYPSVRKLTVDYQLGGGGDVRGYPSLRGSDSSTLTGLAPMFTETRNSLSKGLVNRR